MRRAAWLFAIVALALPGPTLGSTPAPQQPPPATSPMLFPIGPCCFPGAWVNGVWTGYTGQLFAEPGPPFPTGKLLGLATNGTVTLKAGACSQVVTVKVKPGGRLKVQAQVGAPNETQSFHWLSVLPAALSTAVDGHGIDNDRIYAGFYDVLVFPFGPTHFTLDYASSDCPVAGTSPQAYTADATVIKVTVT